MTSYRVDELMIDTQTDRHARTDRHSTTILFVVLIMVYGRQYPDIHSHKMCQLYWIYPTSLTHGGHIDKARILQTIFSLLFSCPKIVVVWFTRVLNVFPIVQLPINKSPSSMSRTQHFKNICQRTRHMLLMKGAFASPSELWISGFQKFKRIKVCMTYWYAQ